MIGQCIKEKRGLLGDHALDKLSGQVIDIAIGKRTTEDIKKVVDKLLLAKCKHTCTGRLNIYRLIIPFATHGIKRYGTNRTEAQ